VSVDLVEMFFRLARVNAALRAELDRSLLARHRLAFEAFEAMTVISERPRGCDEGALARHLGLTPDEARGILDSLVSSGYAKRARRPDGAEPPSVMLTLRGTVVMSRAGRIVDESLERTIGSALSRQELSRLEHELAHLRRRLEADEPSSRHGDERRLAADARPTAAGSVIASFGLKGTGLPSGITIRYFPESILVRSHHPGHA
jgi:DNA-binding MarR family transcriptional regulator